MLGSYIRVSSIYKLLWDPVMTLILGSLFYQSYDPFGKREMIKSLMLRETEVNSNM